MGVSIGAAITGTGLANVSAQGGDECSFAEAARPAPAVAHCASEDPTGVDSVTVSIWIGNNGGAVRPEITSTSNRCLDVPVMRDTRNWGFDNLDECSRNRRREFTLKFRDGKPINTSDNGPLDVERVPPRFPDEICAHRSRPSETVLIKFDVDQQGRPRNAKTAYSTNDCYDIFARKSVSKWRYSPLVIEGVPTRRMGLVTEIKFQPFDGTLDNSAAKSAALNGEAVWVEYYLSIGDPEQALFRLEVFEADYGDWTQEEPNSSVEALFYSLRARAYEAAGDINAAIKDFERVIVVNRNSDLRYAAESALRRLKP